MKIYLVTLLAGLLVGVIYSLLNVRSPAPPLIALVGLLGILVGEQIIPVAKHMWTGSAFSTAWERSRSHEHVFGPLPGADVPPTGRAGSKDAVKEPEQQS